MTARHAVHILLAACLSAAALLPNLAPAQTPERRARIVTLWPSPAEVVATYVAALEEGLVERGWDSGKADLVHYFTDGRPSSLAGLAERIAATRPAVIWTPTNAGATALQRATRSIPVVVGRSYDPVGAGLAKSLVRPGGNVTGMTAPASATVAKRIEILKEIEPEIQTIAVLYGAEYAGNRVDLDELRGAARSLGLGLEEIALRGVSDFNPGAIVARMRGAQALIALGDGITFPLRQRIADTAIRSGMTTVAAAREFCAAGMLICLGNSVAGQFRQSGDYIDAILRGADPALLAMRQPFVYELTVNLGTARALRVEIPAATIARADEVIE